MSTSYTINKIGKEGVEWDGDFVILFPDSLAECRINYADSLSYAKKGIPGIGFVFDPYSKVFDPNLSQKLLANKDIAFSYKIDTLSIAGKYHIANYNEHSPDTLRIFLSYHNAYDFPNKNGEEYFSLRWNNPYQGVRFLTPIVQYDDVNNIPQKGSPIMPIAESTITENYVLSKKDTTDLDYKYIKIPVDYYIPQGEVLSVMIKFIPGYDYDVGEVLLQKNYDDHTKEWINTQYFQNTFDIATIEDTVYANFVDWGYGFNSLIMESMDVRYGIDTFFTNEEWNLHELSAYIPFVCDWNLHGEQLPYNPIPLPIPIIKLDISSNDFYIDYYSPIVLKTNIPSLLTKISAVLDASINTSDEVITDKGFLFRKSGDTLWYDYPVYGSVFSSHLQGLLPNTEYEICAYANTALNKYHTGGIVKFKTPLSSSPFVATDSVKIMSENTAILYGHIIEDLETVISKGFLWRKKGETSFTKIDVSENNMQAILADLQYNTVYEFAAFATTAKETYQGELLQFDTQYANIADKNGNSIKIYPNPNSGLFRIECSELQIKQVALYGIVGNLIQSIPVDGYEVEINMQKLQNGVYYVKITTNDGVITKKISKQ